MVAPRAADRKPRGVSFYRRTGRWVANLWVPTGDRGPGKRRGTQVHLGAFATEAQAVLAYDRAAFRARGVGAPLNAPRDWAGDVWMATHAALPWPAFMEALRALGQSTFDGAPASAAGGGGSAAAPRANGGVRKPRRSGGRRRAAAAAAGAAPAVGAAARCAAAALGAAAAPALPTPHLPDDFLLLAGYGGSGLEALTAPADGGGGGGGDPPSLFPPLPPRWSDASSPDAVYVPDDVTALVEDDDDLAHWIQTWAMEEEEA